MSRTNGAHFSQVHDFARSHVVKIPIRYSTPNEKEKASLIEIIFQQLIGVSFQTSNGLARALAYFFQMSVSLGAPVRHAVQRHRRRNEEIILISLSFSLMIIIIIIIELYLFSNNMCCPLKLMPLSLSFSVCQDTSPKSTAVRRWCEIAAATTTWDCFETMQMRTNNRVSQGIGHP